MNLVSFAMDYRSIQGGPVGLTAAIRCLWRDTDYEEDRRHIAAGCDSADHDAHERHVGRGQLCDRAERQPVRGASAPWPQHQLCQPDHAAFRHGRYRVGEGNCLDAHSGGHAQRLHDEQVPGFQRRQQHVQHAFAGQRYRIRGQRQAHLAAHRAQRPSSGPVQRWHAFDHSGLQGRMDPGHDRLQRGLYDDQVYRPACAYARTHAHSLQRSDQGGAQL